MLSFIKFLNYLNNNPNDLSDSQKEQLHSLLFCNPHDAFVNPKQVSSKLETNVNFGNAVLMELNKEEVINLRINCLSCGLDQEFSQSLNCVNCSEKLDPAPENIFYKTLGVLPEDRKYKDNQETVREAQLSKMISVWENNKYIVYLLIDISNSEGIQNNNDIGYKNYLDLLREVIQSEALRVIKGSYLCFGEIGDCFKLGFSDVEDVIPFVQKFAEIHNKYWEEKKYPPSIEGVNTYPCIKISAQLLELPKNATPKALLFKTLTGALDFNSSMLTKLFRLDGKIKLNYEKAFKNNYISVWIFDKLATKIGLLNEKKEHIRASKHPEDVSEAEVIALSFPNGKMSISDDPKSLLVEVN
ncbi:MAG: hypothetical protein HUJ68_01505 [Clostridia bacterium]|nr:hypothetical protein [Clostridia bacterium]